MANLTTINLSTGTATDTGTVSTLDNLLGLAGSPSSNVQTVQPPTSNLINGIATATSTNLTAVTAFAAPSSGYNYITAVTVSNAHATIGTNVSVASSSGTAFWTFPAAPAYGGATHNFNPPLKQISSNGALYFFCSTNATITISVNGFSGT